MALRQVAGPQEKSRGTTGQRKSGSHSSKAHVRTTKSICSAFRNSRVPASMFKKSTQTAVSLQDDDIWAQLFCSSVQPRLTELQQLACHLRPGLRDARTAGKVKGRGSAEGPTKPAVFRCSVAQGQASRLPTKHLRRVRHYCIRPPYSQEMSRQLFCQVNIDTTYFVHRCR